jgi:hypothetical protein
MLESQIDQHERKQVLRNDLKVRQQQEQSGTYLSQTHSDLGGRFSVVDAQTVVGADPIPAYPAAAAHQRDPVGQEPALGYRIDELEPSFPSVQAPDPTSADAHSGDVQRTGVGPSSNKPFRRY